MYGLLCERLGKLPDEVGEGMSMPQALRLIEAWTEGAEVKDPSGRPAGSLKPRKPTLAELQELFGPVQRVVSRR